MGLRGSRASRRKQDPEQNEGGVLPAHHNMKYHSACAFIPEKLLFFCLWSGLPQQAQLNLDLHTAEVVIAKRSIEGTTCRAVLSQAQEGVHWSDPGITDLRIGITGMKGLTVETKYRTCCTANAPLLRAQRCVPFRGARRGPPAGNPVEYGVKNLKCIGNHPVFQAATGGLLGQAGLQRHIGL